VWRLWSNVENTRLDDGVDSLFAGAVEVTGKFGMLDETALIEKGEKVFAENEVILYAIDLSWSGRVRPR
jgi:hypothetical protein